MEALEKLVSSIVTLTIDSLHERGLLLMVESDEQKAARMFGGKLELSLDDLRQHPACGWSRKMVLKLLKEEKIEDTGSSARDYRISAVSVYRFLTATKVSQPGLDMNKPPAKRNRGATKNL